MIEYKIQLTFSGEFDGPAGSVALVEPTGRTIANYSFETSIGLGQILAQAGRLIQEDLINAGSEEVPEEKETV